MAGEEGSVGQWIHNPYKVAVPAEKRLPILQDLVAAYQGKFGDAWRESLVKNLRPSPLPQIAAQHGVSLNVVRSLKHTLWLLGNLMMAMESAASDGQNSAFQPAAEAV